jgi:aminoglycoside phosphotransferase (APT) family kinase protein
MGCQALEVFDRRQNRYSSTFPSEIVECVLDTGETRSVLCKYSGGIQYKKTSHSRGVEYEADVYRYVLQPGGAPTVAFYGSYEDGETGWTWLVVEHLAAASRLDRLPESLESAAAWIGAFHAVTSLSAVENANARLHRWDDAYYWHWAIIAREQVRLVDGDVAHDILRDEELETWIRRLVDAPACVVHGEYYPKNILVRDGQIFPIDWESASVGAGEIDLASMTERWPADDVIRSKQAYCQSRWPNGAPAHFEQTFLAAQVYWHLRWLSHKPGRMKPAEVDSRWRELAELIPKLNRHDMIG